MKERPTRRHLEIRRVGQAELAFEKEAVTVFEPLLDTAQDCETSFGGRIIHGR